LSASELELSCLETFASFARWVWVVLWMYHFVFSLFCFFLRVINHRTFLHLFTCLPFKVCFSKSKLFEFTRFPRFWPYCEMVLSCCLSVI
jgi:hypothetical protein